MDPLHPFVPIQPPPPPAPTYGRVERIQRDGQRESHPDWERDAEEESEEQPQDQYEDDYDPSWEDPTAVEPYGPDGAPHDTSATIDLSSAQPWDPRTQPDRRARPRDLDDDAEPGAGHIDISA